MRFFTGFAVVAMLAACAAMPDNSMREPSSAFTGVRNSVLSPNIERHLSGQPGMSGTILLGSGLDAFVARVVLAETAEVSIDAQYYLFHDDLTGRLLVYYLLRAADRGVRVRLLVDDMAVAGMDDGIAALDSHPNFQVRVFNPFSRNSARTVQYVTRLGSVTRRMHNKSFTVDNTISILGGRNIGDEYFDANPEIAFSDLDVLGFGPFVPDVSKSFDRYWNSELSYPALTLVKKRPNDDKILELRRRLDEFVQANRDSPYLQAARESNLARALRAGKPEVHMGMADVVYDQPEKISAGRDKVEYHLHTELEPYIAGIRSEFLVVSPYFVPGEHGVEFFRDLEQRGVRVVVLTNALSSTDVAMVHAGYAKYREDLLRAGVELYELDTHGVSSASSGDNRIGGSSGASLHAKTFVIDHRQVFIGSMNLDPRSYLENTEIGLILSTPEAGQMADKLEEWMKGAAFRLELKTDGALSEEIVWHGYRDGKPVTHHVDPYTSAWKRFLVDIFRLMPIESQL
jgi:putative cardiolipin synthase